MWNLSSLFTNLNVKIINELDKVGRPRSYGIQGGSDGVGGRLENRSYDTEVGWRFPGHMPSVFPM